MGSFLVARLRRQPVTPISDSCDITVTFHTPYGATALDEKKLTTLSEPKAQATAARLGLERRDVRWERVTEPPLGLQGYEENLTAELRRQMPRPLLRACPIGKSQRRSRLDDFEWTPAATELVVWNLGAALLTVTYAVRVPRGTKWEHIGASASKNREELSGRDQPWVAEALAGFARVAKLDEWVDDPSGSPTDASFWGAPLWTFFWIGVLTPPSWAPEWVDSVARALIPEGEDCHPSERDDRSRFRIGLSACCVSRRVEDPRDDRDDRDDHELLRAHVETHTACWGSALVLNSHVWGKLVDLRVEGGGRIRELGRESNELLALGDKVAFFLATLEGVRPHLDVRDSVLWECLDIGWKFPDVRRALEKRLDAVRKLQTEKSDQVSNKSLRRLNKVAVALSVVSILSLVGTAFEPDDVRSWLCRRVPLDCAGEK